MTKSNTRQPAGCLGPGTSTFNECYEVFLYASMKVYTVGMQVVPRGLNGEKLPKWEVHRGRGGWLDKVTKCTMFATMSGLFSKSAVFAEVIFCSLFRALDMWCVCRKAIWGSLMEERKETCQE